MSGYLNKKMNKNNTREKVEEIKKEFYKTYDLDAPIRPINVSMQDEVWSFIDQALAEQKREIIEEIEEEFNKRKIWLQGGSPELLVPEAYWNSQGFDSCLKRVKEVLDKLKE